MPDVTATPGLVLAVAVGSASSPSTEMVLLWALVGVAAVWDVAQRRIPNPLILTGLLLGLALEARSGGLAGLGFSFLGGVTALGVLIVPFALRKLGGGDVKLAMVCGVFLGWRGALHVVLVGALVHGALAMGMLVWARFAPLLGRPAPDLQRLPQAVGLAVAAVVYSVGIGHLF
jgi:Flp pilus assembly protein protease CpaA